MVLSTVQKTWKSGTTLCISIPKNIETVLGIETGDYLQIDWTEIIKRKDFKGREKIPRRGQHKGEIVLGGVVIGNVDDKKEELPEL